MSKPTPPLPRLRELLARPDVVNTGYLTKQGGAIKTWRERFFVLTSKPPALYYFKSKDVRCVAALQKECSRVVWVRHMHSSVFCGGLVARVG